MISLMWNMPIVIITTDQTINVYNSKVPGEDENVVVIVANGTMSAVGSTDDLNTHFTATRM